MNFNLKRNICRLYPNQHAYTVVAISLGTLLLVRSNVQPFNFFLLSRISAPHPFLVKLQRQLAVRMPTITNAVLVIYERFGDEWSVMIIIQMCDASKWTWIELTIPNTCHLLNTILSLLHTIYAYALSSIVRNMLAAFERVVVNGMKNARRNLLQSANHLLGHFLFTWQMSQRNIFDHNLPRIFCTRSAHLKFIQQKIGCATATSHITTSSIDHVNR